MTESPRGRRLGSPPGARWRPQVFHGWRIVAVLAVTETVSWGILYYAFAVFQVPIGAELGLSSAQLTGAFSLAILLTGLASVPVGRWLDARGPRGLMTAGSVVSALLVLAWSQVQTALGLYLVLAGIGVARAAVLYDPAFAVIVRWFHRRRSAALLAVTVVAGLASTIALPTSNALIEALGWRDALVVLALVLAVLTVIPHWVMLRRDPADLGLHPDGSEAPPRRHEVDTALSGDAAGRTGLRATVRWAAHQPAFRWYAAAFASQSTAVTVVAIHLVPFLLEQGHTAVFAASATGALGALSVTGRLAFTGAGSRLPMGRVAAAMFALQGTGILVLLAAGTSTPAGVAFVLLFGLGFGIGTVARPALLAQTFGVGRYATIAGVMTLVTTLATTTGPFAAGVTRTVTGSYTLVLVTVAALCGLASASIARAVHLSPPPSDGGVLVTAGSSPPRSR